MGSSVLGKVTVELILAIDVTAWLLLFSAACSGGAGGGRRAGQMAGSSWVAATCVVVSLVGFMIELLLHIGVDQVEVAYVVYLDLWSHSSTVREDNSTAGAWLPCSRGVRQLRSSRCLRVPLKTIVRDHELLLLPSRLVVSIREVANILRHLSLFLLPLRLFLLLVLILSKDANSMIRLLDNRHLS